MNSLVVYYSRTGITKHVGEIIADKTDGDIEEIISEVNYNGKIGFAKAGKHSLSEKIIDIGEMKHDPADYDVVYLGCPVWAGKAATPLISYLKKNDGKFREVKFFLTAMSSEFEKAFAEIESYSIKPSATLGLTTKEVKKDEFEEKLSKFIG